MFIFIAQLLVPLGPIILVLYIPILSFQGILVPFLSFMIGKVFSSPIFKINAFLLVISIILNMVALYYYLAWHRSDFLSVLRITNESFAIITYVLVLIGFVFLNSLHLSVQEMQAEEQVKEEDKQTKNTQIARDWFGALVRDEDTQLKEEGKQLLRDLGYGKKSFIMSVFAIFL